jgi:hypothetical protein
MQLRVNVIRITLVLIFVADPKCPEFVTKLGTRGCVFRDW